MRKVLAVPEPRFIVTLQQVASESVSIACAIHGNGTSAVVCRHHISVKDLSVGFVENSDDPDDLQAWCAACERLFISEGEMTKAFRAFNDFVLVCVDCYAEIKARHSSQ